MSDQELLERLPEGFGGMVRLFPLPNVVAFPHTVQALHIFEPRYRDLLADALAGDELIAMSILQPGWETDYDGRPPIFASICIGKVVAHARLEDGRSNILLRGLSRATVLREFPPEHAFRLAEVAVVEDVYSPSGTVRRAQIQRELLYTFQRLLPAVPATQEQFQQLLSLQLPLGAMTDIVAHLVPFDVEFKRQLLAEGNVDQRSELLLNRMRIMVDQPPTERGDRAFPPDFSSN